MGDEPYAVWLVIDSTMGFAPIDWQSEVGDVTAARPDREALTVSTMAAINWISWTSWTHWGKGGRMLRTNTSGRGLAAEGDKNLPLAHSTLAQTLPL